MRRGSGTWGRLAALAVIAVLATAACGDGNGLRDDTTRPPTTPRDWNSCTAPEAGYTIQYPDDWHTNPGAVDEPCHWFDPEPVVLAPATDVSGVSIHIRQIETDLDTHMRRVTASTASDVVNRRDETVAGRPAVVVETRSTGQVLLPAGTRSYAYYVDLRSRVLAATTIESDADDRVSYDEAKDVLDRMTASLTLTDPVATCSASGLSGVPEPQAGLPPPVVSTRRAIVDAATDCDYERLAALAETGERAFTASFGGAEDVAAFWRDAEQRGGDPLRFLVALLDRPYAQRAVEGTTQFLWPSAYAHDDWAAVPEADKEALRPLYGDPAFEDFAQFGAYTGYRVGMAADGEWLFFVAGD